MLWLIIAVVVVVCEVVGFALAKFCKEEVEEVPPHYVGGGVRRRNFYGRTRPRARRLAKWLTLRLSEYLISHWDYVRCVYDDGEKTKVFLGHSLQEAIDKLLELGIARFDEENFSEANRYSTAGYEMCMREAENDAIGEREEWRGKAKDFRRMRDNALAETNYRNGLEHFGNGNFVAAEECLTAAVDLCSEDKRKEVFRQKRDDALAEIENNQGLTNLQDGNHDAARDRFENALILSNDAQRSRAFQANFNNAEAELHNQLGERALDGAGHDIQLWEAVIQNFVIAVQTCTEDYVGRERFQQSLRQARLILQNLTTAANSFQLGMAAWNAACDYETRQRLDDARNQYDEALRRFNDAHRLVNDNTGYQNWAILCRVKIRGNGLFNQSAAKMNEGNIAFRASQYRTARNRYVESQAIAASALNAYREGALMGIENTRFDNYAGNVGILNEMLEAKIRASNFHLPMLQFQENEQIIELAQRQNNDHAIIHHVQI